MATRIQSATANSAAASVSTLSVTLGSTPTAGNWLVFAASGLAGTGSPMIITEDVSVSWVYYVKTGASSTSTILGIGKVFSGASATQTVTTATGGGIAIAIAEYSMSNAVVDRMAYTTASSTTCVSGTTGTTSVGNGLWVAAIGQRLSGGTTFSAPTNSFTIVGQDKSSLATASDRSICLLEFLPSSTGAASTGVTASGSGVYTGIMLTLYEMTSDGQRSFVTP